MLKVERVNKTTERPYPVKHNTNTVFVNPGQLISIELDDAYFPDLPEDWAGKGKKLPEERKNGSLGYSAEPYVHKGIGNRELLIYANIYRDGKLFKHSVISDLVEHVTTSEFATITNPRFFTETIDAGYYQILIKAFEVNTTDLVRVVRRSNQLDYGAMETSYNFGEALSMGISDFVKGAFGIASSITGRPLDSLVAQARSVPIMEHSIYIVPRKGTTELNTTSKLVVIGNSTHNSFLLSNEISGPTEGAASRRVSRETSLNSEQAGSNTPNSGYDKMLRMLHKAGTEEKHGNIADLLYQYAYGNPFMVFNAVVHDDGATKNNELTTDVPLQPSSPL